MKLKITIAAALAILIAGVATGCGTYGESHNHNAPAPASDVKATWVRIESPGNYHTIIRACVGQDGVYLTQADNNSVVVIPNDPECSR